MKRIKQWLLGEERGRLSMICYALAACYIGATGVRSLQVQSPV